jgi:hypothetical protein
METITIVLEKDHIYALAMEAHRRDMRLNDFITMIAVERADGLIKKYEDGTD